MQALTAQRRMFEMALENAEAELAGYPPSEPPPDDLMRQIEETRRRIRTIDREIGMMEKSSGNEPSIRTAPEEDDERWIVLDSMWTAISGVHKRVQEHEVRLGKIESVVNPKLPQRMAVIVSTALMVATDLSWAVSDVRVYFFANPVVAAAATIIALGMAVFIRWLPSSQNSKS